MPEPTAASSPVADATRLRRGRAPRGIVTGIVVALVIVSGFALISYRQLSSRAESADGVTRTLSALDALQAVLGNLRDAETGMRGYLITRNDSYLAPYHDALAQLPGNMSSLRRLVGDQPREHARLELLESLRIEQLDALRRILDAAGAPGKPTDEALAQIARGKAVMDRSRMVVADIQADEQRRLEIQQTEYGDAVATSFGVTLGGALLLLMLIALTGAILLRNHRDRGAQAWRQAAQAGLARRLFGERRLDVLGDAAIEFAARYSGALVGVLYAAADDGRLLRIGSYAAGDDKETLGRETLEPGRDLTGQVAKTRESLLVSDVPLGYRTIASSTGSRDVRQLLIAPAVADDALQGVIELGFFRAVDALDRRLIDDLSEQLAVAIRAARDRERVERLLEQTQQQAQELQAQQEELRVSNEELEEQGRALKTSHVQLENQQAELEETNSHLEEQSRQLEDQADELVRAHTVLAAKADELERTNQYKSEFLANMSHELRTPLNSTLILAKLLAENKDGNLTEEQIRFAETISSAGNDLLALINDILDLAKIESGKVDVVTESVDVRRLLESLSKTFEPMAKQKGIAWRTSVGAGAPAALETDAQRLGQILRNLLANALKFTQRGDVALDVSVPDDDSIAFSVSDSGIGIPAHQHQVVFDAFRQADGSTHRRYGGTGLGLSISRNLARLLGGDITLESVEGRGSRFTLVLPRAYVAGASGPQAAPSTPPPAARKAAPAAPPDDDRAQLAPHARVILVIEDDTRFAAILQDVVHEAGFQCIVANGAADGVEAARKYQPSGILLDMHLPDHSGLGVLDQLKRNARTRHIPVHVASVADYRKEARELGAVGYDLKPVDRAQIVQAVEGLRERIARHMRRVLIVEDDARQLESLKQLLAGDGVEIVGVSRADAALAELRRATFDCMVMDLHLPDLSGYELLERMSAGEDVAFPPVIVYTGRVLTSDEEQRLSRHSRSIIVKDARSPERLLDEVTLFLHQVEADLPPERQRMLREARKREAALEGRRILIVEDDVRNVFALTRVLEPKGVAIAIARNGLEALARLDESTRSEDARIDLVLMDIMMPEMDGLTAMREIRKDKRWKKLPIVALTAKAMRDDQEECLAAGANDYMAKPLDVEKLLSLVRVWMPKR